MYGRIGRRNKRATNMNKIKKTAYQTLNRSDQRLGIPKRRLQKKKLHQ